MDVCRMWVAELETGGNVNRGLLCGFLWRNVTWTTELITQMLFYSPGMEWYIEYGKQPVYTYDK